MRWRVLFSLVCSLDCTQKKMGKKQNKLPTGLINHCSAGQHIAAQHSKQPKHDRAMQSWVKATAHWLFILEQHWTQHMQQQWPYNLSQQLEAAFIIISAASGSLGSSVPGATGDRTQLYLRCQRWY
ncbi:unnamed protein product [Linum tenue]|uniref:Secreted protein n=1 Tax=Linum tenue TaxID=586396 RepID=A0AAV0N178_9ROSI|nr:unnamed protein product [Linum tenue]